MFFNSNFDLPWTHICTLLSSPNPTLLSFTSPLFLSPSSLIHNPNRDSSLSFSSQTHLWFFFAEYIAPNTRFIHFCAAEVRQIWARVVVSAGGDAVLVEDVGGVGVALLLGCGRPGFARDSWRLRRSLSSGISSSLRFEFRHRSEFAFRCKHCNYLELDCVYNSFVQIPAFIPSNWKLEIQMAALAMDWPSFSNLAILL